MRAERCLDYGVAIQVCTQVFDEISEDGITEILPDVVNEFWVGIHTDQLIGMYRLHQLNLVTYQLHALILPEHRSLAKETRSVIFSWCLANLKFNKLVAEIPAKYQNVYHFAKGMGFIDEGINRASFQKDGKIWDTYRLGITREEINQWFH